MEINKMKDLPSEKLNELQRKWENLQWLYRAAARTKDQARWSLLEYIVDQSIPVSNRWDVFLEAPVGTLRNSDYAPLGLSFWGDIRNILSENYRRHATVFWSDLDEIYADENTTECLLTDDQKEEVMALGCESFSLDW